MQGQEKTGRSRKVGSWLLALMVMMSAWCSLGGVAHATDYTWRLNSVRGDWYDATNWTPTGVPGASDTAIVPKGNPTLSRPTSVAKLYLDAGLSGEDVTVLNEMHWTDGVIYGSVTIDTAATLSIEGNSTVFVTGTLNSNGTVVKTNTVNLQGRGTVNNAGIWRFANSFGIQGNSLDFNNSGTIIKEDSASETLFDVKKLLNTGRIVVNAGTLNILNGDSIGALQTAAGATIKFYNVNLLSGSSIVGAGSVAASGQFDVVGTTLIGPGAVLKTSGSLVKFTNATFDGQGRWEWSRGIVRGDLTTGASFTTIIGGVAGTHDLEATLTLRGTTEQYVPGSGVLFSTDSTINNYGTYTIRTAPSDFVPLNNRSIGSGLEARAPRDFVNFGTFNVEVDAATSANFINRGQVNLRDNFRFNSRYNQQDGITVLEEATLTAPAVTISGGSLIGRGTVNGDLVNGAVVAPGYDEIGRPSVGVIRVEGNYEQLSTGALNLELGGEFAGGTYDALQVTKTATLAGTFNPAFSFSFPPQIDQRFDILSYQARVGQFSTVSGTDYAVEYGANLAQAVTLAPTIPGATPRIATFSPRIGLTGTTVMITGDNLGDATQVIFGRASATITNRTATQLTVIVPDDASSGRIRVLAPGGSDLSAENFAVVPRITGFTPMQGVPGTIISIAGKGIGQVTRVSIGGVNAVFKSDSTTMLRARIPVGARTGRIVVTTLGGTATSDNDFTVGSGPAGSGPSIATFSPPSAPVGASVILAGSNLGAVTQIFFGSAEAAILRREANRLLVTVPVDALSGRVRAVSAAGTTLSAQNFSVLPHINNFSPSRGSGFLNTVIALTGSGFNQVTGVTIGGVRAQFQRDSSVQLRARIPVGARTGKIVVTTLGGTAVSSADFTVLANPPSTLLQAFLPISTATAEVATSTLTLRFVSHLAGIEANDCQVLVNGAAVEIDSVAIRGAVLTIALPSGSLKAGDSVEVQSAKFGRVRISNP